MAPYSEKNPPRTLNAQEAVKRARRIVEENNKMVELLRKDCINFEKHLALEREVEEKSKALQHTTEGINLEMYRIKTSSSVASFFRDMFGG
jgi:hypothetical protein